LDLPSTLTLEVGEERTLPLPAAGSVGYLWHVRVTGAPGTIQASVQGPSPPAVTPGTMPSGGSAPQMLEVRGLRAGRAEVHLKLIRPFGAARAPRASMDLMVIVEGTLARE
jgi:predicted secreted protein